MCTLSIRRETITDNVTAPAMVPTTMPANAPLLIPELGELPTSVTLVKIISIKNLKTIQQFLSHIWIYEINMCLTQFIHAWGEDISNIRCELEASFLANIEHNLIAQKKNIKPLELRILQLFTCECNCIYNTTEHSITMVKALNCIDQAYLQNGWQQKKKRKWSPVKCATHRHTIA